MAAKQKQKKIIIVDSNSLAYRAMYAMKELHHTGHEGVLKTGVIFGFMSDVLKYAKKFESTNMIFCWDSHKSFRKVVYPTYKTRSKLDDPDSKEMFTCGFPQFDIVRTECLPNFGFKNIFMQVGIESDDLMTQICLQLRDQITNIHDVVMITSDEDMFQCLDWCDIWLNGKKKMYTRTDLLEDYGVKPHEWPMVKAIGGCTSDTVDGIANVKEKTAVKYLHGELKKDSKAFLAIEEGWPIVERNKGLVTLPHPRTQWIDLQPQPERFSFAAFTSMCYKYGFKSFLKDEAMDVWCKTFWMQSLTLFLIPSLAAFIW